MLGATTNTTATGASTTELELSCITCLAHFGSKQEKRVHMKEEWQWVPFTSNFEPTSVDEDQCL